MAEANAAHDEIAEIMAIANAPNPNGDTTAWSPTTLEAFALLDPDERKFAEYITMGDNATQAYRRLRDIDVGHAAFDATSTRLCAHRMRTKPRVSNAIELAMKDEAQGHGLTREWMFQRLRMAIERAEDSKSVEAPRIIGELVDRIAKLKGEYLPERQEVTVTHTVTPAAKRFMDALNMAKQRISAISGPPAETVDGEIVDDDKSDEDSDGD